MSAYNKAALRNGYNKSSRKFDQEHRDMLERLRKKCYPCAKGPKSIWEFFDTNGLNWLVQLKIRPEDFYVALVEAVDWVINRDFKITKPIPFLFAGILRNLGFVKHGNRYLSPEEVDLHLQTTPSPPLNSQSQPSSVDEDTSTLSSCSTRQSVEPTSSNDGQQTATSKACTSFPPPTEDKETGEVFVYCGSGSELSIPVPEHASHQHEPCVLQPEIQQPSLTCPSQSVENTHNTALQTSESTEVLFHLDPSVPRGSSLVEYLLCGLIGILLASSDQANLAELLVQAREYGELVHSLQPAVEWLNSLQLFLDLDQWSMGRAATEALASLFCGMVCKTAELGIVERRELLVLDRKLMLSGFPGGILGVHPELCHLGAGFVEMLMEYGADPPLIMEVVQVASNVVTNIARYRVKDVAAAAQLNLVKHVITG